MGFNTSFIYIKTHRESFFPRSAEESFYYFIKNSRIKLISDDSAYGLVFLCSFKKDERKSPYFSVDLNGHLQNVITIALKVFMVSENDYDAEMKWKYVNAEDKIFKKHIYTKNQYFNESKVQSEIPKHTVLALNRNSPILMFSKLYDRRSKNYKSLRNHFKHNSEDKNPAKHLFEQIDMYNDLLVNGKFFFGIYAMEIIPESYKSYCDIIRRIIIDEILSKDENKSIDKYDSLSLSPKSERLRLVYNITRYELLRLALDAGYSQGDYHTDNLFIDERAKRTFIIDFEKGTRIPNIDEVRFLWLQLSADDFQTTEENLQKLRRSLLLIYNSTFENTIRDTHEFKWLKDIDELDYPIMVDLHKKRKASVQTVSNARLQYYFSKYDEYVFRPSDQIDCNFTLRQKIQYYVYGPNCLGNCRSISPDNNNNPDL